MRRDLTTGSIPRTMLALAWPTVLAMSVQTAFSLVDAIFVSRYSPHAMAAVTFVFPVMFLTFGVAMMVGIGATSLIARSLGARDEARAETAASHAFLLAVVLGAGITVAGLACQKPLFEGIGAKGDVLEMALTYSTWVLSGMIFVFLGQAAGSVLRAQGEMVIPMAVMVGAAVLNAILDPLLIFGIGIFPELGVAGAAIATLLSSALGGMATVAVVLSRLSAVHVRFRGFTFDTDTVTSIIWVGFPASANHLIMSVSHMLLIKVLSGFDQLAVTAYGIVGRLNGMVIMPCLGIGTAVLAIVGQNVGARRYDRAERTAWTAAAYAMAGMEALGAMLFLVPRPWLLLFTDDDQVIAYGVSFLRTLSLTFMFIGLSITLSAAFQGAGKGLPALAITMVRLVVVAVPLAYVLSPVMGPDGVWTAMAASTVTAGIVSAVWFRAGTWKGRDMLSGADGHG